jgi:LEA14-like dessication related protein
MGAEENQGDEETHRTRNVAIALAILILLVVGVSINLQIVQRAEVSDLQLESVTPSNIQLQLSAVSMNVDMIVHNPNGVPAKIAGIGYWLYANGTFLGSGANSSTYDIPAHSNYTLTFSLDMPLGTGLSVVSNYLAQNSIISWELKGTDHVTINTISFTVPFDYKSPG